MTGETLTFSVELNVCVADMAGADSAIDVNSWVDAFHTVQCDNLEDIAGLVVNSNLVCC